LRVLYVRLNSSSYLRFAAALSYWLLFYFVSLLTLILAIALPWCATLFSTAFASLFLVDVATLACLLCVSRRPFTGSSAEGSSPTRFNRWAYRLAGIDEGPLLSPFALSIACR